MLHCDNKYRFITCGYSWAALLVVLFVTTTLARPTSDFSATKRVTITAHEATQISSACAGDLDCCDREQNIETSIPADRHTSGGDNGCTNDCANGQCDDCSHPLPLASPLPTLHVFILNTVMTFIPHPTASLLQNDIPAPFQPPRA
jgi:hypothetical protein